MDIVIDKEILEKTAKCIKSFSCLKSGKEYICSVECYAAKNLIFVKGDGSNRIGCGYCMSFGDSFVCSCPTRNEIYSRYLI
jgi:hypothetical protein